MKISEIYNEIIREDIDNLFYHGSPYEFDKFDTNKIGTGDGLTKFGHGLYFADDVNTAIFYAKELSKGEFKKNGFNLYTVKIYNLDSFYNWDDETPTYVSECIVRKLYKMGKSKDAEQIEEEYEEYGKYWEFRNTYQTLIYILGGRKETSEFLTLCGVGGVIGKSPNHNGKIYTVYDDGLIKVINTEKIR